MKDNMLRKGILIVIIFLFVGASGVSSIISKINLEEEKSPLLGSGLVAHWGFNEGTGNVLHDVTGSGNDGTIYFGAVEKGALYALYPNGTYKWHVNLGTN